MNEADPAQTVEQRCCCFCGRRPVTREHLIPLWLAKLFEQRFGDGTGATTTFRFTSASNEVSEREHNSVLVDVVVRHVCGECNTGWMADLEGRVKPLATELILGRRLSLTVDDQVLLAHWAAKTAVLIGRYHDEAVVLDGGDVEQVFGGHVPDGFHIRLAFRPQFYEFADLYVTTAHVIPLSKAREAEASGIPQRTGPPNSFVATLAFGALVISIAGGPGFRNPDRWVDGGLRPMMIWPPTLGGLQWPPSRPRVMTKDELRTFHDGMFGRITNPDLPARLHPPEKAANAEEFQASGQPEAAEPA